MNVPQGEPGGNSKTTSPRVKKHLCLRTGCKRGQHSLSRNVLEVCKFSCTENIMKTGGNRKKLPPMWKRTSFPEPAVKGGNTACLKMSWRYAIFLNRQYRCVCQSMKKLWGKFYLSDLPKSAFNIFQIWATFILRSSPHFLLQSFPALIIFCIICRHPIQTGGSRG